MKCRLCERRAEDDLCQYHGEARDKLESTYHYWVDAYGSMTRDEYLRRIAKNSETGEWVAEVAKMMLPGSESEE